MRSLPVLLLQFLAYATEAAMSSIVVFPLMDRSSDGVHLWAEALLPEYFSRKMSMVEGIRMWDPVFIFQTDSTGWTMQSDTLLLLHRTRWEWDAAVGGSFEVKNDSVFLAIRVVMGTGAQHVKMEIERSGPLADCSKICASLLMHICSLLRVPLTAKDSLTINSLESVSFRAYHTYCAGYRFEMDRKYSEALTAYDRAASLSPALVMAHCRSGRIYSLTGNTEQARLVFRKVMDSKNQTFATRAFAADFAIDQLSSKEAFRLIDDSRRDLEKSSIGLTVLGKQLLARGEFRRAISFLRRAVARGPIDLDAEFLLGMAHMRAGEYGAAEDIFNRLISMRPDHVRYQVSLGAVYRHRGKLMESLAVLEAAEKKEPDNTMILVELAQTCFALSWYRRAGQFLERAQQLKPDENVILVDLGIVYWHENRRSDAVRCFREAERQYEGNQASVVNIGTTDFLQGDIDAAIAAYKKANRFGKKNPTVLHNLAVVYLRKGKLKTAARYLDELLLLTPGRSDLLLQRALLARKLGNKEDAELAYRRILENDPADQTAIAGLVELLIHQGRLDEAMFRIESFLENMPARPDFLILLADIYRARGWYEVALTKYQIAVRDFPEYGHGYLGVGRCMYDMIRYKKSTRYDETLFALKLASGKMPSDPEPHVLMGDVYMDYKGYRDMAIEQWEAALAKTGDERKKKLIEKKIVMAGRR